VNVNLATGKANDGAYGRDTFPPGAEVENIMCAGTMDDPPVPHDDPVMFTGDDGPNVLTGCAGADTLNGGGGGDTLVGNAGEDTLNGGAGEDTLDGGAGEDTLDGGADSDTARYAGTITVDLSTDADADGYIPTGGDLIKRTAGDNPVSTIENLASADDEDKAFTGDAQDNTLTGGGGADTLLGMGGDDTLIGGGGTETTLNGGDGNDTYMDVEEGEATAVTEGDTDDAGDMDEVRYSVTKMAADDSKDGIAAGTDNDEPVTTPTNVEMVVGTEYNDVLTAGTGAVTLNGAGGDDTLTGNTDPNVIMGGAGTDTLNGGGGGEEPEEPAADSMDAMKDITETADVLRGGLGDDELSGTASSVDVFAIFSGEGDDNIASFEVGVDHVHFKEFPAGTDPDCQRARGVADKVVCEIADQEIDITVTDEAEFTDDMDMDLNIMVVPAS
jgi:Ca2+-binding RTX toxin-like protein